MASPFAVIAGVGPGTGAALARKFGLAYPVALLARNPDNFNSLVDEINKAGGKAIGISTDVSDNSSVKSAIEEIKSKWGDKCAAAVFNASGPFARKSVLELTEREFTAGYEVGWYLLTLPPISTVSLLTHATAKAPSSFPNRRSLFSSSKPRTHPPNTHPPSSSPAPPPRSSQTPACRLSAHTNTLCVPSRKALPESLPPAVYT